MAHPISAILSAAHFAAEKHACQKRKGQAAEPYINHLIEVAYLVSTAFPEPDAELVVAALLHDVIEDAGVTKEEVAQRFGSAVADLVAEVTDDKTLPKAERKRPRPAGLVNLVFAVPAEIDWGAIVEARLSFQPRV